ncbi:hypothetical protein DIPPA_26623 [Diplonema papillatum]|nr:hypothetical protein DIPPA_26623 [Diplonema papillatum]
MRNQRVGGPSGNREGRQTMESFTLVGGALAAAVWLAGAADDCDYPTVRISGTRFVDRHSRITTLRSVNTAGNSKVPPVQSIVTNCL